MSIVNRYRKFIEGMGIDCNTLFDFKDKNELANLHIVMMLERTQSMFEYENLPETIPSRIFERYLQMNGSHFFTKKDGNYYIYVGGLGGEPDVYYEPTLYTVSNPAQNFSQQFKIGEDGILVRNDCFCLGLLPIFRKYSTLLTENEVSMRIAIINKRITDLLVANDDKAKKSAEKFLSDIEDGNLSVVAGNRFYQALESASTVKKNDDVRLTDLIEMEQYLKASFFNEIGLDSNYNMKRESINATESQMDVDALLPLADHMLEIRRKCLDNINNMYDLDIKVDFNSAWLINKEEYSGQSERGVIENERTDN